MPLSLKHPEAILAQTAFDLVNLVFHLDNKTRIQILEEAKAEYKEPGNSWMRYLLSFTMNTKVRESDFIEAEQLIEENMKLSSSLSDSIAVTPFRHILDKADGSWNDESANTAMMSVLLRHLPDYDASVKVAPTKLKEIYALFLDGISKRKEYQDELKSIEQQLSSVYADIKATNAESELERARSELIRIRQADFTSDEKKRYIEIVQAKMAKFNEQLRPLKEREKSLVTKRVVAMQQLLTLDPSYNISRLAFGFDEMSKEAIKVGHAAISEFITHTKSQENRKKELADIKLATLAKKGPSCQAESAEEGENLVEKARAQRNLEASTLCGKSKVFHDGLFRSRLNQRYNSLIPPKEAVNVVVTDLMRSRQADLIACGGIFKQALPTIAESSSSPIPKK